MHTLGEGNTPLIASSRPLLHFKLESCNPSGSYKDRFAAAEVAHMQREGAKACVATSSGNTGAALAAACARYGLRCVIFVNSDAPNGKLAQMRAHGAQVVRVTGFVSSPSVTQAVFTDLHNLSDRHRVPLVVSAYRYCPVGMAGVEGIAPELRAQHSNPIHHVFVPVGGGGLFSAVCRGFQSVDGTVPAIHAVQPAGCLTTVASFLRGEDCIRSVESTTAVSGLSVPYDIDASLALSLLRKCGGRGISVTDEEVFAAQSELLVREGVYCEPAGAAAFAGYLQSCREHIVRPGETSICLVTGHGFKDAASIERATEVNPSHAIHPEQIPQMFTRLCT